MQKGKKNKEPTNLMVPLNLGFNIKNYFSNRDAKQIIFLMAFTNAKRFYLERNWVL